MNIHIITKIINSAGLISDLVGAWLVAIEVVRKYRGEKYQKPDGTWPSAFEGPKETEAYKLTRPPSVYHSESRI
jgi:hypothetical protein